MKRGQVYYADLRPVDEALRISLALNKEEREVEKMDEDRTENVALNDEETPSDWKSVYIMQSDSGEIKIGISKNVKKRKKSIENNSMKRITNYYKTKPCSNPFEIERAMHKHFEKFRVQGEWFSCGAGEAITVLNKMFAEMAKFDLKIYDGSSLNSIIEYRIRKNKEEQEYIESLEKTLDTLWNHEKKIYDMVEKLISMVENLQAELKIKNEELEKYREINGEWFGEEH